MVGPLSTVLLHIHWWVFLERIFKLVSMWQSHGQESFFGTSMPCAPSYCPSERWTRLRRSDICIGIEWVQNTCWHLAFVLYCHSNETRAQIANLADSAQLGGTPCPSYMWVHAVVWECGEDWQTHRREWPLYISHRLWLTHNVITIIGLTDLCPRRMQSNWFTPCTVV